MWGKVCPNRAEQSTATTSLIPGFKQGENAICPSQSWQEYPNPTTQYHLLYGEPLRPQVSRFEVILAPHQYYGSADGLLNYVGIPPYFFQ